MKLAALVLGALAPLAGIAAAYYLARGSLILAAGLQSYGGTSKTEKAYYRLNVRNTKIGWILSLLTAGLSVGSAVCGYLSI